MPDVRVFFIRAGEPCVISLDCLKFDRQSTGRRYYDKLHQLEVDTTNRTWTWKGRTYKLGEVRRFAIAGPFGVADTPEDIRKMELLQAERVKRSRRRRSVRQILRPLSLLRGM